MKPRDLVLTSVTALGVAAAGSAAGAQTAGGTDAAPATRAATPSDDNAGVLMRQARAVFGRLPDQMPGAENDTPEMIALGTKLYFERGMSINKTQSCNDCHDITGRGAGVDNRRTSPGALNKFGPRNSPTTLNAGFHVAQFWDGREPTLEEQAKGPPLNPIEMGMESGEDVAARVREADSHDYEALFAETFPDEGDPLTFDNIANAIAAFERTFITRGRFDSFIDGDETALTAGEKRGLDEFMNVGCIQCHSGPVLGGMLYQKSGVFHPYADRADFGLFDVTGNEEDRFVFKVPALRNIVHTAPYFHDGQVGTLAEAIDTMGWMQLNVQLDNDQILDIMRFLTSLSDERLVTANAGPVVSLAGLDDAAQAGTQPAEAQPADTPQAAPTPADAPSNPGPEQDTGWWNPPDISDIPAGEEGELIRYGLDLLSNTYDILGPGSNDLGLQYHPSSQSCTNCHQENGTKRYGLSWVGVDTRYPTFRARMGRIGTLEDRINGCFQRSLNGDPVPQDSREMKAMIAYMTWLGEDMPEGEVPGASGSPQFTPPNRKADIAAGEEIYQVTCQSCHGENGEGYRAMSAQAGKDYVAPPLWGSGSYNNGAGMNRLLTIAAFLKGNMPLGTPGDHPALSDDETYDVGAFVNSHERPVKAKLEEDYPDLTTKPVDASYGPYADDFSQDQHTYGPFQPIIDARKAAKVQDANPPE